MEILNDVFKSVSIYFNTLTQLGYKKQTDVEKLLVYNFIEEMLTGEMRYFITEEDYRKIEQALSCLYGSSCLLPYPQYANDDYLFGHIYTDVCGYARTAEIQSVFCTRIGIAHDRVRYSSDR